MEAERVEWAFGVAWDHVVVEDAEGTADAIFCFGSRHWRVPERAATLFHAGVAPVVVVTGGPSAAGEPTEATRFAAELVRRGVPESRLVLEHRARHTGENVRLGLDALGASREGAALALVSWPLAARRCRATFERLAPEVAVRSAPALPTPGLRWAPTPRRIRFLLGELDRLHRYAAEGHIVAQATPEHLGEAAEVLRRSLSELPHDPPFVAVEAARADAPDTEDLPLLVRQA